LRSLPKDSELRPFYYFRREESIQNCEINMALTAHRPERNIDEPDQRRLCAPRQPRAETPPAAAFSVSRSFPEGW